MPAISTGLAIGLGVAGAVGSSVVGGVMASKAAGAQASAADRAAQLQAKSAQDALDFEKKQYEENVARSQPWLKAGTGAIETLSGLTSKPGEGLLTPWNKEFAAPTSVTEQNDPGFKFRLEQAQLALQNSAAAKGNVLSGGSLKGLTDYTGAAASAEYGNVYGRALTEYQQAYNIFKQNQTDTYNKLAGVSGAGQQAASTLGTQGAQAGSTVANIDLTSGQQIGGSLMAAGTARASGYAGMANAFSGGIGNITGLLTLQQLLAKKANPANPAGSGAV